MMEKDTRKRRGRKAIDEFWVEWIYGKTMNTPALTLKEMVEAAQREAQEKKRDDPPSERTIRRYQDQIRNAPESVQREYRQVYWPETFERGDLPWEAAEATLELMRLVAGQQRPQDLRPQVREARWYWYVTLAIPTSPPEYRWYLASLLAHAKTTMMRVYSCGGEWRAYPDAEAARREVENYLLNAPEGPPPAGKPIPHWDQGLGQVIPLQKERKEG